MSRHCRPGRRPEMPALLRRPACPGARPCPGRSTLDKACAPAEYGSYREARTGKISQVEVPTLSGEPRLLRRLCCVRGGDGADVVVAGGENDEGLASLFGHEGCPTRAGLVRACRAARARRPGGRPLRVPCSHSPASSFPAVGYRGGTAAARCRRGAAPWWCRCAPCAARRRRAAAGPASASGSRTSSARTPRRALLRFHLAGARSPHRRHSAAATLSPGTAASCRYGPSSATRRSITPA